MIGKAMQSYLTVSYAQSVSVLPATVGVEVYQAKIHRIPGAVAVCLTLFRETMPVTGSVFGSICESEDTPSSMRL